MEHWFPTLIGLGVNKITKHSVIEAFFLPSSDKSSFQVILALFTSDETRWRLLQSKFESAW